MRRFRRRFLVLLIVIVAAVVALDYAAAPTARKLLVGEVERTTGVAPSVGPVSLSLWRASATAYDVALANPPTFREPTLLQARAVTVRFALLPLLKRKAVVRKIALRGAVLTVERDRQGKTNLRALLRRLEAGRGSASQSPVHVARIVVARSTIRYIDHAAGSPPARLVIEDVQALVSNVDSSRASGPLVTSFRADGAIATPRRGRLHAEGRTNPFHRSVNFDLRLTLENLDLPVLQRLYPSSPVFFRSGLAYLSTSATCRDYRLSAQNRLILHRLDVRPRGQGVQVAGLPLQTVVAFLERQERIELEFQVKGDVRNPQANLRPAVEGLIARAMRDKILAGPGAILRAGKAGTTASVKALKAGKKAGGVVLEVARKVSSGLKRLFGR